MANLTGTTVVLVEDQPTVRQGFAKLCVANGMKVLAQCSYGPTALETLLEGQPDFVILDLHMSPMTGLNVIRGLRSAGCPTKILALAVSREEAPVIEALRYGADAYLLKDGPARHLVDAMSYVRDGGRYVSPSLKGAGLATGETSVPSYYVMGISTEGIAKRLRFWRRR